MPSIDFESITSIICFAYARPMRNPVAMKVVKIFKNGQNQAVRFPKEMEFNLEEIDALRIDKIGDTITLRPHRPNWLDLAVLPPIEEDFLGTRPAVFPDEGRV